MRKTGPRRDTGGLSSGPSPRSLISRPRERGRFDSKRNRQSDTASPSPAPGRRTASPTRSWPSSRAFRAAPLPGSYPEAFRRLRSTGCFARSRRRGWRTEVKVSPRRLNLASAIRFPKNGAGGIESEATCQRSKGLSGCDGAPCGIPWRRLDPGVQSKTCAASKVLRDCVEDRASNERTVATRSG
jgi:hypothetical protein